MTAGLQGHQLPPLHAAAYRLDAQAVKELLQSGSDANEGAGSSGLTACMLACLPSGANLEEDPDDWLELATEAKEPYDASTMEDRMAVVQSLLAAGADPCVSLQQLPHDPRSGSSSGSGDGSSSSNHQQPMALQLAAAAGSTKLLELLIAAAARVQGAAVVDKASDSSSSSAAGTGQQQQPVSNGASLAEQEQNAMAALPQQQQGPSEEDDASSTGDVSMLLATPASLALMADRPEALRLLLQGAWGSFDDPHVQGLPLHMAAREIQLGCVRELLAHGADPNGVKPDLGNMPLHEASAALGLPRYSPAESPAGTTAAAAGAVRIEEERRQQQQQQQIIRALCAAGAHVEARNAVRLTPLAMAVSIGQEAAVKTLLELKANLHIICAPGHGLLELAWVAGQWDLLRDLIQLGVVFQGDSSLPSWHTLIGKKPGPQCILRQLLATADAVCQARAANDTAAAAALQLFMDSLTVTSEDVDAWAAAGAAAEPAVVAPVLISSFNALHPVHGEPGISRSLWKAQMFSGILPASKRDTLAQALLGPVSWPKAGSGSWWAVHAAVLCQDVASLKLLLRLGASASQPVPKPFCEPLMQLLESDRDASRTMLTPLWLCLPLRSEGAAAGPTAMCTASGRAYDMARMAQIVCVLKDHGACISELQPCSLETLEQLADNCGAGVIGLLQALLEPRGPNRQRCWEERLLISAALEGRWRLLQRMLAAQPHQSFSTMQCLAVNAAKAGHIKLLELCLARVATKHLPGVAYETLKDTVLGLGCNAMAERQDPAYLTIVDLLLRRGADVNRTFAGYMSPLTQAFQSRWPALVKLVIGHGADVSIINERELWQKAAAGVDPAVVEELLAAGCPLPPGGVKQLMAWMPATSNTAQVEAQLAAAAAAAQEPTVHPGATSSHAAAAAEVVAQQTGGGSSGTPITAKPLSPAELAAAALRAEAAQRAQTAVPGAEDKAATAAAAAEEKAAKKAAKKQRQAAAKAAAAAEAAAAAAVAAEAAATTHAAETLDGQQGAAGAGAAGVARRLADEEEVDSATLAAADALVRGAAAAEAASVAAASAAAGAPHTPAAATASVAVTTTAAGSEPSASGSVVGGSGAVEAISTQVAGSSTNGSYAGRGAADAGGAPPHTRLASTSAGVLLEVTASTNVTLAEQEQLLGEQLSEQQQAMVAGVVEPAALEAQAGPTVKPLSPAELAAAALRAEMDQQRQLTPEAAAKAAQKAAKKQRKAAAKAESATAAAVAAAAVEAAAGPPPPQRASSSSSSNPSARAAGQPAAGSSSRSSRVEVTRESPGGSAAPSQEVVLSHMSAVAAAALPTDEAALLAASQQHDKRHWMEQQQHPTQQQQQWQQGPQQSNMQQHSSLQVATSPGASQQGYNEWEAQQQLYEQQQLLQPLQQEQGHVPWGDPSQVWAGLPPQHMLPMHAAAAATNGGHSYISQPPYVAGTAEQPQLVSMWPPAAGAPEAMGMPYTTGDAAAGDTAVGGVQEPPRNLPGAAGLLLALDTARQAQLVQQQRQQVVVGQPVSVTTTAVSSSSGSSSALSAHQVAQERMSSSSSAGRHAQAGGATMRQAAADAAHGQVGATSTAGQQPQARPHMAPQPATQPTWAAVTAPPMQQQHVQRQQQQRAQAQTAGPSSSVSGSSASQARAVTTELANSTGGQMRVVRASWQKECVVCLDAPSAVLTLPCAHLTLCAPCAQGVLQRAAECPMCRTPVETQVILPPRVMSSR